MSLCLFSRVSQSPIDWGRANEVRMLTGVDRLEQHLILTVPLFFPRVGGELSARSLQDHPPLAMNLRKKLTMLSVLERKKNSQSKAVNQKTSTHQRKTRESRSSTN